MKNNVEELFLTYSSKINIHCNMRGLLVEWHCTGRKANLVFELDDFHRYVSIIQLMVLPIGRFHFA